MRLFWCLKWNKILISLRKENQWDASFYLVEMITGGWGGGVSALQRRIHLNIWYMLVSQHNFILLIKAHSTFIVKRLQETNVFVTAVKRDRSQSIFLRLLMSSHFLEEVGRRCLRCVRLTDMFAESVNSCAWLCCKPEHLLLFWNMSDKVAAH